jgi:hypothetical protein
MGTVTSVQLHRRKMRVEYITLLSMKIRIMTANFFELQQIIKGNPKVNLYYLRAF